MRDFLIEDTSGQLVQPAAGTEGLTGTILNLCKSGLGFAEADSSIYSFFSSRGGRNEQFLLKANEIYLLTSCPSSRNNGKLMHLKTWKAGMRLSCHTPCPHIVWNIGLYLRYTEDVVVFSALNNQNIITADLELKNSGLKM